MKSREYTITLTDYMKQYQSDNDIKTKITSVELLNKNQLKNKRPKFIITTDFKVYVGTENEQYESRIIACDKCDDKFVVPSGWGQLTGAVIESI